MCAFDTIVFYLFGFFLCILHLGLISSNNHGHSVRNKKKKPSKLINFPFAGGLHAMTSGGNVSLLQRESLTREEVFGIAWLTCLRSFVQAQLSVLCLYHFSAAHPTRLFGHY